MFGSLGAVSAVLSAVNQKAEELKRRTRRFALDVITLVRTFPRAPEADIVGWQLIKAATGVAANYRSTCRARSHAEFVARIGVVLEEADESEFWLDVTWETELSRSAEARRLWDESGQLRAIFSTANLTARSRSEASR